MNWFCLGIICAVIWKLYRDSQFFKQLNSRTITAVWVKKNNVWFKVYEKEE